MEQNEILVVDDDREIVEAIKIRLEAEKYQVEVAYDGLEALDVIASRPIKLLIIDVMMPNMDGFSAIMKIREKKNIPIIIMSAKTEDTDKILGLSIGADDYITKPFNALELVARVKSQMRRYLELGDFNQGTKEDRLEIGRLCFHFPDRVLYVDGETVALTAKELGIVELLFKHPGHVFSAEEIFENVWKEKAYSVENTIMVHIRRIREKVELNPKQPEYIKVVWGIGYKLENKDEKA